MATAKTAEVAAGLKVLRLRAEGRCRIRVDGDVADEIIEVLEDPAVAVSLRNRHQLIESLADTDGFE